jgi:hypothetical protein
MRAATRVVAGLAAVAASATVAAGAGAAKTAHVSGTWTVTTGPTTKYAKVGGNIRTTGYFYSTWSGDLAGSTVAFATFVIHPDGRSIGAPVHETFTGTLAGVGGGTIEMTEVAHGTPDGSAEVDASVVGGTGALGSLHGRLVFLGTCDPNGNCAGTYSGTLVG